MANDANKPKSLRELITLLNQFLRKAGVRGECEVCGQAREWSPIVGLGSDKEIAEDTIGLTLAVNGEVTIPGRSWIAYAVSCNNCSNVRLFAKPAVWTAMAPPIVGQV